MPRANSLKFLMVVLVLVALFALSAFSEDYYLVRAKTFLMMEGDMTPTLNIRDRFVARRVIPEIDARFVPDYGDVVVFSLPNDPDVDHVMRVVGLPGDTLQVVDGVVVLNGTPLKRELGELRTFGSGDLTIEIPRYRETLPNGVSYLTNETNDNARMDNTPEYLVPEDTFFAMGDNRDAVVDSRFLDRIGYVPFARITAVAKHVYYLENEKRYVWRPIGNTPFGK